MLYIPTCSISSTSPLPWYLHDVPTKYHGIYVWFNTDNSSMDLCELVQSIPMDTPKSGDRTKTHSFWWPNNVISRYPSFWDKPIHDMYTIHTYIYIYMLYVSTCSYSCSGFVFLMGYVSRWYAGACMLFLLDSREWNIPSFLVGQTSLFIGNILVRTSYVPVSISWSPCFGVVYPCLSILVTLYILYYCHKNKNSVPCFDISEQVQMKNNGHESYVT